MEKIKKVIKRSGTIVNYKKQRIVNAIYRAAVAVGGRDKETSEKLADEVENILAKEYFGDSYPHIEEIQDIVEKVLIKNGHSRVAKAYILYRNENQQKRREKSKRNISQNIPWQKIWHILDWAANHKLLTISDINDRLHKNEFCKIVHESESAYEDQLDIAKELIAEKSDSLKLVFVSGPSSSGKTTSTIKLENRLNRIGLKFKAFNVDNYFYDLEEHPKDEFGDYDFETPQALDLDMINEHISRLIDGEKVKIPYYDFSTGARYLERTEFHLEKNEILLIDSLHGLYPSMSKNIDDKYKFKLYLEPLFQIKDSNNKFVRWTDIRLIRRMLRDAAFRAYNPQQTLEHWHYVRSSEIRHIIPYINQSDYIINTAMPYELPLYKAKLFNDFKKWQEIYKDDPLKQDAYQRAKRIAQLMEKIVAYPDESCIPKKSLIREFIGGSSYKY